MIYILLTTLLLWALSTAYFLRHILLITKELEEIGKEQHTQNKDIMHLLKMDFEIAKVVDNHGKSIVQTQTVLEYMLSQDEPKKNTTTTKSIFEPTKGEA